MNIDKKELRIQIKKKYSEISPQAKEDRSRTLFRLLSEKREFREAEHILAFWSLHDEPSTHQFCKKWCTEKNIYLPVIQSDSLIIRKFINEEHLKADAQLGVPEPQDGEEVSPDRIDLILVPGLAFDVNNNRLGRGKGFYDRFLPTTRAYKIGICFDFQLLREIPVEEFDVKMDEVLFV